MRLGECAHRHAASATVMQVGTVARFLGRATNNEAEYQALIMGLEAAQALGIRRLQVKGDSKLIIEQVRGR